ncbi:hypothetical protein EDB89DRAFT_2240897 [Lactarius sanguifluus]|nr:hypothetical protein EDB89DRAFT_2240897 [Lactarius sanguifluus]
MTSLGPPRHTYSKGLRKPAGSHSAADYASRHLNVGCQLNDAEWKEVGKRSTGTEQSISVDDDREFKCCVTMECRWQRGCAGCRRDGGGRSGVVLNPGATAHCWRERYLGPLTSFSTRSVIPGIESGRVVERVQSSVLELMVRIVRNVEIGRGVNGRATEVLPVQLGWDGMSFQGGKNVERSRGGPKSTEALERKEQSGWEGELLLCTARKWR